jgi:hypothetical protein
MGPMTADPKDGDPADPKGLRAPKDLRASKDLGDPKDRRAIPSPLTGARWMR